MDKEGRDRERERKAAEAAAKIAARPKVCREEGCTATPIRFPEVDREDGTIEVFAFCGPHGEQADRDYEAAACAKAREDFDTFAEMVCTDDETGEPIRQAPIHKRWAQLADKHDRLIIWSHVEAGKCEAEGSRILLSSGAWAPIESLVGQDIALEILDPQTMTRRTARATIGDNGKRTVVRITTKTGRVLRVTKNHPVFAPAGWKEAEHIKVGDFLGAARTAEGSDLSSELSEADAEILGYLVGDGGLTDPSRVKFTNIDDEILSRLRELCEGKGWALSHADHITYAITRRQDGARGWDGKLSPSAWARSFGIDCLSKVKRVPSQIFSASRSAVAAFLGAYVACDGSVGAKNVEIGSASKGLLEDVHLLLLRFGIKATIRYKLAKCQGKEFDSWRLSIEGDSARIFADRICVVGAKAERLKVLSARRPACRAHSDGVPSEWRTIHPGFCHQDFHTYKILERSRKNHRALVRRYLKDKPDPIVDMMAAEAVTWDEVTSVETEAEPVSTYSVSVRDQAQCYLSSGFLSHNTTQLSVLRTVWELGRNTKLRFVILSNTATQASIIVKSIATYIETNETVKTIFPNLVRDPNGSWTTTALQVKRPNHAKDPSIRAVGVHGALTGGRIDRLIIDDILDGENTDSPANRKKLDTWVRSTAFSRLTKNARVLFVGNAWHPEDLLHELASTGQYHWVRFPILDKAGNITWPSAWSRARIEKKRKDLASAEEFARQMLCQARDDSSARFKQADIDKALVRGRHLSLVASLEEMPEGCMTFTGVDLAMSKKKRSDDTVFFTFMQDEKGNRTLLNIEIGKFTGADIVKKIIDHHERYKSIIAVESNAAQSFILDFTRELSNVPIVPHTTTRAKRDPVHGVEGLSIELANGKWIIPSHVTTAPEVDRWIREMLFYAPRVHTGDVLMACYFAREVARQRMGAVNGTASEVAFKALGVKPTNTPEESPQAFHERINTVPQLRSDEEAMIADGRFGGAE